MLHGCARARERVSTQCSQVQMPAEGRGGGGVGDMGFCAGCLVLWKKGCWCPRQWKRNFGPKILFHPPPPPPMYHQNDQCDVGIILSHIFPLPPLLIRLPTSRHSTWCPPPPPLSDFLPAMPPDKIWDVGTRSAAQSGPRAAFQMCRGCARVGCIATAIAAGCVEGWVPMCFHSVPLAVALPLCRGWNVHRTDPWHHNPRGIDAALLLRRFVLVVRNPPSPGHLH